MANKGKSTAKFPVCKIVQVVNLKFQLIFQNVHHFPLLFQNTLKLSNDHPRIMGVRNAKLLAGNRALF